MFSTLRSRLLLSFALMILIVLIIVPGALFLFIARNNLVTRVELRNTAGRILQRLEIPTLRTTNFEEAVNRIEENFGYRALVVDTEGKVVADSQAVVEADFPPFPAFPPEPVSDVLVAVDQDGKGWLFIGRKLPNGYTFIIAEPRQPLRELVGSPVGSEMLRASVQSGVVAMLISLVLAFWISNSVASPLQKISNAAKDLSEGKQTAVTPEGPKEVRLLAETFNDMSQKINSTQQSQRDFVANVSHELKTPLTSVQGFAQAILDGTASAPEAQEKAAQIIYDESGRMYRMVLDLLDLAKLDAGTADLQRERVDLKVLLENVLERFTPQSNRAQVALQGNLGHVPEIVGDGDRLSQVFGNLVDNALKHTPAGGTVTLSARWVEDWVHVSVTDNGPGLPQEELSRIFERFYQLDKARQGGPAHGSGLGLSIANQIVQAHRGELRVESEVGKGSVFTVVLPVSRPDDPTLPTMPRVKV